MARAYPKAKLSFLVVQKRIHTRFLLQLPDGRVGNPAPGSVVDGVLGMAEHDEWYMFSTSCILNTAKPVHYILLHDDQALGRATLQALTFGLCMCYPNWSGA